MKNFVYSIHDKSRMGNVAWGAWGAKIVGKVVVVSENREKAKEKITEYIKEMNDNVKVKEEYYDNDERYYSSMSKVKIMKVIV